MGRTTIEAVVHAGHRYVVCWRLIWCAVLCCASLLAASVQGVPSSIEVAQTLTDAEPCLRAAGERAGDPRSGTIPGEHASAVLAAPHLAGTGGPADRPSGRALETPGVHRLACAPNARRPHLSARPLTIPLLI